MRVFLAPALALCLAGATVTPALAASFDCNKAQKPDEIAVCANPRLSEMDTEMGALWFAYSSFPMLMGMNGNRQDEARAFLQTRAACGGNVPCLRGAYSARIATLKTNIKLAAQNYCSAG